MHRLPCLLALLTLAAIASAQQPASEEALRREGAFGFPQKEAVVLCDIASVRISAWNDREHLFVQAVVFADGDDALGETDDGRPIGDTSEVMIDCDADGEVTARVDRDYLLDPWPSLPGLRYQVLFDGGASSGITSDSKGRGAIRYLAVEGGRRIRVDSFLIPLAEIGRKAGDPVRIAYWGKSTSPDLVVNSVGFWRDKPYYGHHVPRKDYHAVTLADRESAMDMQLVPEGRGQIALEAKKRVAMPETGKAPPEVAAGAWLNWTGKDPPTLASLKGKVVVVEFWATWCGPCVGGIPHLNELHERLAPKGVVILSLTDQKKEHIEEFMRGRPMKYPVGVRSTTGDDYGITTIPHAFVVARDGTLAWEGLPSSPEFEKALEEELARK